MFGHVRYKELKFMAIYAQTISSSLSPGDYWFSILYVFCIFF